MTPQDLFTKAAAAREMGVTATAVRDRIQKGKLASKIVGGVEFVTRAGIDHWKKERADRGRQLIASAQ